MSKDEFYVEPDGDGDPTLWVDDVPIVSLLSDDDLFVAHNSRHEQAVWRAAVSVLAPDEETVRAVAAAIHKASREGCVLQARAAVAVLRDRAVSE